MKEPSNAIPGRQPLLPRSLGMVLLAFLSNNAGYGLVIGAYASILPFLARLPGSSLTLASAGISLLLLSMGLLSPVMAALVQRFPLRILMAGGAALCAAAFVLMSLTDDILIILGCYLALLGPGVALMGTVPTSALIGMWVTERRGLAMGFVNIPVVMSVTAPIASAILIDHGLKGAFLALAAGYSAMIPVMLLVRNAPPAKAAVHIAQPDDSQRQSARYILSQRSFWLIVPTGGIIAGTGVMLTTHAVALGIERGVDVTQAALLLSAYGLAGIPGSFLFGALADRLGGTRALAVLAIWLALGWVALLLAGRNGLTLTAVFIAVGLGSGGLMGPFLSALASRFGGGAMLTGVMGIAGLTNTAFIFGLAPLAGYLHGIGGTYAIPILVQVVLFLACAALFLIEAGAQSRALAPTASRVQDLTRP